MPHIDLTADELVATLLKLSETETVCLLDSSGVGHLGSHRLIAGIEPVEVIEVSHEDPKETLALLDDCLSSDLAAIFTLSYDLGSKLSNIAQHEKTGRSAEPDLFLARFNALIKHDYRSAGTSVFGSPPSCRDVAKNLKRKISHLNFEISKNPATATSNFTKADYLAAIDTIKERIRSGDTYQANLTQQLSVDLPLGRRPAEVFRRLRNDHPAAFAAYIKRRDSFVVSASPERFIRVYGRRIETSPIKGTRRRGTTEAEDAALRHDLLASAKDRAENTMIVDLLRNDLGRVCEYGSVRVEKLCDLEEHPTLFHLVSTVSGELRRGARFSDILRAVFPCGSVTGAPKISTMRIIDEIETVDRGLSMGAIGYYIPPSWGLDAATFDLSVAIRTMVICDDTATFNVGGGVTIDSDPQSEYDESLLKAKALLDAIGGSIAEARTQ